MKCGVSLPEIICKLIISECISMNSNVIIKSINKYNYIQYLGIFIALLSYNNFDTGLFLTLSLLSAFFKRKRKELFRFKNCAKFIWFKYHKKTHVHFKK